MSRDSEENRAELLSELAQELRQLKGLSASFVRAAAARSGVTVTDMEVIESLTSTVTFLPIKSCSKLDVSK